MKISFNCRSIFALGWWWRGFIPPASFVSVVAAGPDRSSSGRLDITEYIFFAFASQIFFTGAAPDGEPPRPFSHMA
jgi:hypothetical protein